MRQVVCFPSELSCISFERSYRQTSGPRPSRTAFGICSVRSYVASMRDETARNLPRKVLTANLFGQPSIKVNCPPIFNLVARWDAFSEATSDRNTDYGLAQ